MAGETKASLDDLRIDRKQPRRSRGVWIPVLVILLLLVSAAGFTWWWNRPRPIPVRTAAARELAATNSADRTVLNASGYVVARREATVSSKVTGKVVEVLVEEGMKVEQGQVLARLDDTNVKASLRLVEAQLESAKAALEETRVRIKEADLTLRRTTELARNSISAQAELERAEAESASLKARLEQQRVQVTVAEREVASWQQQLDDTIIRAPFAGIVTSKNAQPGEMISPISAGGGFTRTGICTIVDMNSLEVEVDVNEGYINRVQAGQAAQAALDAYADWKIPCHVIAIVPTADRQKSTVRVRLGFETLDPRILPEMSIKVSFRQNVEANPAPVRTVLIPKDAVQRQDGRDVVMLARNGRAERRSVRIESTVGTDVSVNAGIAPGDTVILEWPAGLKDGSPIKEIAP